MAPIRAGLYLDFDNVFLGLHGLDPVVAVRFADDPGGWLERLTTAVTGDAGGRWLVLRCYLNPGGWVPNPDPSAEYRRLYFSRFRRAFVRAGFEVIDCPLYNATKNAADIRLTLDAMDALSADPAVEQFVIVSGDSDMTPLLHRLRRADRRTVIVTPSDAAEAFLSVADQVVDSQQLFELVQGELVDEEDSTADPALLAGGDDTAYESFRSIVTTKYEAAKEPLNMASLAIEIRRDLGEIIAETDWFGFGGFGRAVRSLHLFGLRLSSHHMWDETRHTAPTSLNGEPSVLPEPVERLVEACALPRIDREQWPLIYQTLSDYARSHSFNLTECTRWSRDRLRDQGHPVPRSAVLYVTRGTASGGCPLHESPPPTAQQIGAAFVSNVLSRVYGGEEAFTGDELAVVRDWLGDSPRS
ncbi:NYN domain-containing protein [Actinoallomurus rhizosphaericola]|uniref:NYN domain-containing protein n=1 Tax=Actinoallomurus rhizosphaericola TaxID=2952536 RepID=UPI0020929041|nr:NYN domain-containing protein [Actinoallomurus rhizosphaericola]MCO5997348.1 NYN domain-containing protein [Actinoallomurus rhizosphaericola]